MENDNTFRLMLIVAIGVFAPIAIYYRVRSFTDERLDRWQEGVFILFGLRLGAIPSFFGLITWMINPQWMAWSSIAIPAWSRWLGLAVVVCSGTLLIWTFRNLGKNLTDTVVTRRDHTFVRSGPYRYVRHPFYLTIAMGVVGFSLTTANWFFLLAGAIPLGFLAARTRIEEEKLVERFGVEYEDYMRCVGRFFPRFKL